MEPVHQGADIGFEIGIGPDRDSVVADESSDLRGKLPPRRHLGAPDQHRDHEPLLFQCRPYLVADRVIRISQALSSRFIGYQEPARPDSDQNIRSLAKCLCDVIHEVDSQRDVLDVDVHEVVSEAVGEPTMDAQGILRGVVPSVTEEDADHQ